VVTGQLQALQTLWRDTFSVTEYQEVKRPNGSTGFDEVTVIENEPCKLSFSTLSESGESDLRSRLGTDESDMTSAVKQRVKLFCDKTLDIPAGARITVTRDGRVFDYAKSGEPGVFTVHQEIELVPYQEKT
jgi:hypothetical protein